MMGKIFTWIFMLALPMLASGQSGIEAFEYWIGDNSANRTTVNLQGARSFDMQLDLSALSNGFHRLNLRFRDSGGRWTPVQSKFVYKAGTSDHDENLVMGYRYWFGHHSEGAAYVNLSEPARVCDVATVFDVPFNSGEVFNMQFIDLAGQWSLTYTRKYRPLAAYNMFSYLRTYSFTNQSMFGKDFHWDFDDGNRSTGIHPSHTYHEPGEYTVRLITKNSLGSDTLLKHVTIAGIRDIQAKKGGNAGFASV